MVTSWLREMSLNDEDDHDGGDGGDDGDDGGYDDDQDDDDDWWWLWNSHSLEIGCTPESKGWDFLNLVSLKPPFWQDNDDPCKDKEYDDDDDDDVGDHQEDDDDEDDH